MDRSVQGRPLRASFCFSSAKADAGTCQNGLADAEIVGAGLLALGLFTRLSALSLVVTMLVAIYFHVEMDGFVIPPLETASLYGLSYLLFAVNGGGLFSVDTLIKKMFTPSAD